MTRLTIKISKTVEDNAVAAALTEPREQLAGQLSELADRLHDHIYGMDARTITMFNRQVDLDHQWFSHTQAIGIICEGFTDYPTAKNKHLYLHARLNYSQSRLTPLSTPRVNLQEKTCKPDLAPFREAALILHAEYLKHVDFEKSLRQDVRAIMAPHNTIAKLIEAWPQATQLLPVIDKPVALPVADPSLIERATNIIFGAAK